MKRILLTQSTHTNFNPFVPSTWQPTTQWCCCSCWYLRSSDARMAVIACQVRSFPAELGYFNTVAAGCFSCPRVEATPIKWYLAPGMRILLEDPRRKTCILPPGMRFLPGNPPRNRIGLVLSSNWVGFVAKAWQPWSAGAVDNPRVRGVGWLKKNAFWLFAGRWIR